MDDVGRPSLSPSGPTGTLRAQVRERCHPKKRRAAATRESFRALGAGDCAEGGRGSEHPSARARDPSRLQKLSRDVRPGHRRTKVRKSPSLTVNARAARGEQASTTARPSAGERDSSRLVGPLRCSDDLSKVEGALGLERLLALTRGGTNEHSGSKAVRGSRVARESARDSTATPHVVDNAAAVGRKTTSREVLPFESKLSVRRQRRRDP